ncbi:MAG TPA: RNA polymerase sigma factor [Candidatus Competibacter sp.]|nr:RNA polymerase sigma factor [Candidatus Competibacter sp.]
MADFAQLVTEQIPRLRRYARALVGAQRADDLVQDCLERAWSRRRLWDGQGELRAWLFTILHNLYVNDVRRQASSPALESLPEEEPPALAPSRHEAALDLRDLQRALDHLSPEQREVLLLVGLEQLDYAETATVLNVPLGTVMSRLARAREALRRVLREPPRARLRRVK